MRPFGARLRKGNAADTFQPMLGIFKHKKLHIKSLLILPTDLRAQETNIYLTNINVMNLMLGIQIQKGL